MNALPHVIVGGRPPTEEHFRVFEAWNREHEQPTVWSVANINLAVDWWNGLQTSPAAGLYCLDAECDCREHADDEATP